MRKLVGWITTIWITLAGAAAAQNHPVVVELFTSQGCSSCPPADQLLGELARRDDVIALALHVDYWDYIGWKDVFAQAGFTKRQKAYAAVAGLRSIYTPQMVVQGTEDVVGNRRMDVADLIRKHESQRLPVSVDLARNGSELVISARALRSAGPADIHLVRYEPEQIVAIKRGENAGRTLTYHNIVTDWRVLGRWDGQGTYKARLSVEGPRPVVVLVQRAGYGPILAAARLR
ncbi:DUF1223 domain-containing protein [Primorskyibacter marinus]|uniref:DUF1223 domain-containing protein n=1 Tax=Primorskyibacter marinus TaxID=1977320 RepID=UPI000E302C74|nr:DUF1223 domain-containing protein [Primorskyibacter marinus]